MEQLSALDAAFLYLETRKAPLHVGALHIFCSSDKKHASFEWFLQRVKERLPLAPVLQKRLLAIPFDLDAPYLVEDPEFSLNTHVSHIGLPDPADRNSLNALAARIHRNPLDRHKALWELTFVDHIEGLDLPGKYHFAIISKVHHCIVDDMGGEELLSKLLDFSPNPNTANIVKPNACKALPSRFRLLFESYKSVLHNPSKMISIIAKASTSGAKLLAQKTVSDFRKISNSRRAPASLFERELSDDRVISSLNIPLAQLKICRTLHPKATIHDIILAIISQGLHDYLTAKQALPGDSLTALVPMSHRRSQTQTDWRPNSDSRQKANQLRANIIELATTPIDIRERIQHIQKSNSTVSKKAIQSKISQLTEFLPSVYLSLATKLYTRWHISAAHRSLFNLVITNVPGPQIPLYMGNAKLIEQYGTGPIFQGMGLSIVVLSYNGTLSITVNSCSSILAEPNELTQAIYDGFHDLYQKAKPQRVDQKSHSQERRQSPRSF